MPATPKVWITSDFHFFHENVMIYSDRYSDEFHNINDYQNALMSHLASFVKKDDIFLFLGDIALSKDKSVQGCKDLISLLECENKHFIRGNHDKWLQNADIYAMGFKSVRDYLKIDRLLICHYPLCADGEGEYACERRYKIHEHLWDKFYKNPAITKIIHGHTHNNAYKGFANVEYVNVSVDKDKGVFNVLEFTDIAYDEFKAMLEKQGVCEFSTKQGKKRKAK